MAGSDDTAADLLIVGGGINGAGIARDAAGRGLRVVLCEQGDLAAGTSSASSKLIHGGLRYLEQFAFRLVGEALDEREVLLAIAPHIARPITFVLPHRAEGRPMWMVGAGLWLYDRLGRRKVLQASRRLDLRAASEGRPLKDRYAAGFAYADAYVDDARLVILNAMDARARGAEILTRTALLAAEANGGLWVARLRDTRSGREIKRRARCLVNAAGPWVERVSGRIVGHRLDHSVRLVKGSHIVVPRLYDGDHAYVLPNDDGRVVFVIPYEDDFSLVGTTDVDFSGDPAEAAISSGEIQYLCDAIGAFFVRAIRPGDAVWTFSGVRALSNDGRGKPSEASRDYVLDMQAGQGAAPVLSVIGGKITTYRRLAEKALAALEHHLPAARGPWTATAPLPGGDMPGGPGEAPARRLMAEHGWLPPALARRYTRLYGTMADSMLAASRRLEDLGAHLGAGLYEREVAYLVENEWAETAEDILWRRTKLGLRMGASDVNRLARLLVPPVATVPDATTAPL